MTMIRYVTRIGTGREPEDRSYNLFSLRLQLRDINAGFEFGPMSLRICRPDEDVLRIINSFSIGQDVAFTIGNLGLPLNTEYIILLDAPVRDPNLAPQMEIAVETQSHASHHGIVNIYPMRQFSISAELPMYRMLTQLYDADITDSPVNLDESSTNIRLESTSHTADGTTHITFTGIRQEPISTVQINFKVETDATRPTNRVLAEKGLERRVDKLIHEWILQNGRRRYRMLSFSEKNKLRERLRNGARARHFAGLEGEGCKKCKFTGEIEVKNDYRSKKGKTHKQPCSCMARRYYAK